MDAKERAIDYRWTPDTWAWVPHHGRVSDAHGRPSRPVHISVSTQPLPASASYDFWRETVFYGFEADKVAAIGPNGFQARVDGLITADVDFYHYHSDAVSGQRTRRQASIDGSDGIDIGLVLAGQRRQEFQNGDQSVSGAGQLYVYDATSPSRVEWSGHRGIHMSLKREAVEKALGRRLPSAAQVSRLLAQAQTAPMLASQMSFLAREMNSLDVRDQAFILNQTVQLTLYTIDRIGMALGGRARLSSAALLAAAERYILTRLDSPTLDADELAVAIGCSRATLYRALAAHDLTVSGLIQNMRLAHARALLQQAPFGLTNEDLAARCGFTSVRSFLRAFKARFETTPSRLRQSALDGPG